jgi:hypothetical protein
VISSRFKPQAFLAKRVKAYRIPHFSAAPLPDLLLRATPYLGAMDLELENQKKNFLA